MQPLPEPPSDADARLSFRIPLPRLGEPPAIDAAPAPTESPPAASAPTSAAPGGAAPRIKSFIQPRILLPEDLHPALDNIDVIPPEEGRLKVILGTLGAAMRQQARRGSPFSAGQRQRVQNQVIAHLQRQLDDATISDDDRLMLKDLARRLVRTVMDDDYSHVLTSATVVGLRSGILEEQDLPDYALLRVWGIGDLTDNGVQAVPSGLRGEKIPVHRASLLVAEGLLAAAYHVEQAYPQALLPADVALRVGAARLAAYAIESGLSGRPLLISLDRIERLSGRTDGQAQGHLAALRALLPDLRRLARWGVVGPLTFVTTAKASARPPASDWTAITPRLATTDDVSVLSRWIGALPEPPAVTRADDVPLPLLRSLLPTLRQRLDRDAGRVELSLPSGERALLIEIPPLSADPEPAAEAGAGAGAGADVPVDAGADADASAAGRLRQDEHLARLDAFILVVFADTPPSDPRFLPPRLRLTPRRFSVARTVLAERGDDGAWHFNRRGMILARQIYGDDDFSKPDIEAVSSWARSYEKDPHAKPPPDTRPRAQVPRLRLFLQMENEKVMHLGAVAMSRLHPDEVVWVQVQEGGRLRVMRGQSLLDGATKDTALRVMVSGHGRTSAQTGERVLSGRGPVALVQELRSVLRDLLPDDRRPLVDRIDLFSCALETEAAHRSFGREFARAARDLGPVGMETTVYSQLLVFDLSMRGLRMGTQLHAGEPIRAGASGTTWAFRSDPVTGIVSVRDKFPDGDEGRDIDAGCCATQGGHDLSTQRSLALLNARLLALNHLRARFGEVVRAHRPPGTHLLPLVGGKPGGSARLSFLDLTGGGVQEVEVEALADAQVVREGMRSIRQGLAKVGGVVEPSVFLDGPPDMLNFGMFALMLAQLAGGGASGRSYQMALWGLGMAQGGFQAGADVTALASTIMAAVRQDQDVALALVVEQTKNLSRVLRASSAALQAVSFALDLATLVDVLRSEAPRPEVKRATVRAALDAATLGVVGVTAYAEREGLAVIAAVAEGLLVPTAGMVLALDALDRAVEGEVRRLDRNLTPLREIRRGYKEPLTPRAVDDRHPRQQVIVPQGWAPIRRIDFVKGEVVFADATVGATVLHRNQLYWQFGSDRLHDWWIDDKAGDQGRYARHGLDLDLWTLMQDGGMGSEPRARLTGALRDPGLPLGLMTTPNVEIRFDRYSASRAGGDLSLIGDPLVERMQANSDAFFVGDFVSSSSFARSADHWRITPKPTVLEVVLDNRSRVLALPSTPSLARREFSFQDDRAASQRRWKPLDQSQVHVRLIGGGGRYTLTIPADGSTRNPVRILPSSQAREVWTLMVKGGFANGGMPLSFLDRGVTGLRFGGQEVQFEALHGAIVQLADPLVPALRAVLDLERRDASLVLTLPAWSPTLNPIEELRGVLRKIGALQPQVSRIFAELTPDQLAEPVRLAGVTANGEALSGLLDPVTGDALLFGDRDLMMLEHDDDGRPLPWAHYALKGGEVTLSEASRPVVRYDGGRYLEPVTFTYLDDERRFVRDPILLTRAGERALSNWMLTRPGWTRDQLSAALAMEFAVGVELAGPEGGVPEPVRAVQFDEMTAGSRRSHTGATELALWDRLDRLERHAPEGLPVSLHEDPGLAHALVLAGLPGFQKYEAVTGGRVDVPAEQVKLAKRYLILLHAQVTGAYGTWSNLRPPAPPLTLAERTRSTLLLHDLQRLMDEHLSGAAKSDWIRLGHSPFASEQLAHRLRDEGLDIQIDALSRDREPGVTDRAGPEDFYDVKASTMHLFIHDLRARLDADAGTDRRLRGLAPVDPRDTPLQWALAREAVRHREVLAGEAVVTGLSLELLEQVTTAGLTMWIDRDTSAGSGKPGRAAPALKSDPGPGTAASVGRVWRHGDDWATDASTLRLWQDQAATQGLRLDAWYARHAAPGSAIEPVLRDAAVEALRDRLIGVLEEGRRGGRAEVVLDPDPLLNRQLLVALVRLLPAATGFKQPGDAGGRPGDVFRFLDPTGQAHFARMRRPDPMLSHLTPDLDRAAPDPHWAYLGSEAELGASLQPTLEAETAAPIWSADDFLSWRRDDPAPRPGQAYAYDNPFSGRLELFRLLRLTASPRPGGAPYAYLPIDGNSNEDWRYLGSLDSLSAAELGTLAQRGSPLRPQAFAPGLLEWWADRLAPGSRGEAYRSLSLDEENLLTMTRSRSRFQLLGPHTMRISLDDGELQPFLPAVDAELERFRKQFLGGRPAPRWVLIQTNGRAVDLDGVSAMDAAEIVIMDEPGDDSDDGSGNGSDDGVTRQLRVDLDDLDASADEIFYQGRDLLIHRPGKGPLIRIRNAIAPANPVPVDDEWKWVARVFREGGMRELVWPTLDRSLRLPLLTLHGDRLHARRMDTDLRIGDATRWDEMRVPDVYASDDQGGEATGTSEALLRVQGADGTWRLTRMGAPLVNAIGRGLARDAANDPVSLAEWRRVGEDDLAPAPGATASSSSSASPPASPPASSTSTTADDATRWRLDRARLVDAMAAILPTEGPGLAPQWKTPDGLGASGLLANPVIPAAAR